MYSKITLRTQKVFLCTTLCFAVSIGSIFARQQISQHRIQIQENNQAEALAVEHTLKRWSIGDLQLSPDGTQIAMTVTEPIEGTTRNSDIWLLNVKTHALTRFTTSEKSDNRPRWSPDGNTLAFLSNRSEKSQIYLLQMQGGEAESLTKGKNSIRSFEWSPDGTKIAYLAQETKTEEEENKEKDKDDARVADRDDKHSRLWILDVQSREVRQLTKGEWRISEYAWSPLGDRLIISATDHPQPELETNCIYSVQVSDGSVQKIGAPIRPYGNLKISPDGQTLAYVGTPVDGPDAHDLFILPMNGGEPKNLTGERIDRPISSYTWCKDDRLTAQVVTGFTSAFHDIRINGKVEKQRSFQVHPTGSFVTGEKWLAFVGQTATHAPEVWISRRTGQAEQMTRFNAGWDSISTLQPETFTYTSYDGTIIEASLLKPVDYQVGSRVPLVVLVHGGPTGRWADSFHAWGQLLAARGFAILYPNIRGSIGYGHDFVTMNRRDWGGGDFKDVMAGVDHMIQEGIADPERLGIGGWSYGGYMAAWAVTQTNRFKASVSGAPMTDLAFEYGSETSSINPYDTWFMGTPYENLDLFIERSPMTHVKNVRTPTLILCGENDVIDPIEQCRQFYRGLKRYNVDTEFVIYPREGHGIREERHQIDLLNRVIDWFEKYLK